MLAGVNDRYEQALALARACSTRARLQGQPDPLQPDRDSATTAPRARRSPPSARCSSEHGVPRDGAPHARARHRRRLRPARRAGASRPTRPAPPGAAAPPAAGTGARLAGPQQALAQLGLLLGRRIPARDVRQLVERAQAEQLQEQRRRAVEDGAELRVARLLDQPALEQRRRSAESALTPRMRVISGRETGCR